MKNALFTILFIFLAGSLSHFGMPWWTLVFVAAIAAVWFPMSTGLAWFSGFTGGFLLWSINAMMRSSANDGVLAGKIGQLFMGMQPWQLVVLTGVLGGLLSAFGVLSGKFGRALFVAPKQKRYRI